MSLFSQSMSVLPVFEEMAANGMPASRPYFEALADEMTDEMDRVGRRISSRYWGGRPFNPNSDAQVRELMRRKGLKALKPTAKTGLPSTAKDSIEYLRFDHDIIDDIFTWREHAHIRDSFCRPILDRIPKGADIYDVKSQLKTTRVATRRLASADPNLLNIPIRTPLGRRVREGFRTVDGEEFFASDLSQVEMRVAAHVSMDLALIEAFYEGLDVHAETAAVMNGVDVENVTKTMRDAAKTTGFGVLYGQSAYGLRAQLWKQGLTGYTEDDCRESITGWLEAHDGVAEYIDRVKFELKRTGVVKDLWGMPRYLPGVWSREKKVAKEAVRIAVNHTIQGTAQGMIQESMGWMKGKIDEIRGRRGDVKWRLQVHDEVVLTVPTESEGVKAKVERVVVKGLTQHAGIDLVVPVEAESSRATNWGGLK